MIIYYFVYMEVFDIQENKYNNTFLLYKQERNINPKGSKLLQSQDNVNTE